MEGWARNHPELINLLLTKIAGLFPSQQVGCGAETAFQQLRQQIRT